MKTLFPGEATSDLVLRAMKHFMPSYKPTPVVLVSGQGVRVFDRDGRAYLDMVGGIAVNSLGHAHPRLVAAIAEQAAALVHVSNLYINEPSVALADELVAISGMDRVFFSNSGAEANEAALKAARRYQTVVRGAVHRTGVLAFTDSFHGRTFGALSVTGQPKYHQGFEPLVPGARFVRFGDMAAVDEALAAARGTLGAIIVEPIQCEGGINMPPAGFLEGLRERADRDDLVLIFDEVQTGVGRTGTWWCFEHHGMRPDILTTAKGIAGGVPLGAMMATEAIAQALQPGTHASTFGANPLATRAGLEVLRVIQQEGLLARAAHVGARLHEGLRELIGKFFGIAIEARGRGLVQGLELATAELATRTVEAARERGLLLNAVQGKTLRFVPALVATEADIDEALALTEASLAAVSAP
jgi:predicted acetylornithine/succinylornithine family transaminase